MNPGSTWVGLNHVDFCSVNVHLPGLNPVKLNPLMEVGSTYPGSIRVGMRLHCKNPTWVNSTQVEPGFIPGNFFRSVNRAIVSRRKAHKIKKR